MNPHGNSQRSHHPRRSLLFVPANRPDRFAKMIESGADMICLELEDGVPPNQKDMARQEMLAFMANYQRKKTDPEIIVRINSPDLAVGKTDIRAILAAKILPSALMIPKVNTARDITALTQHFSASGHDISLHLLIETCAGLENCYQIARASDRLEMILFGGVDLAAELGCVMAWEPLTYARQRVVHAAASAGLDLMDMPYLDLDNQAGLISESKAAKTLGYGGKAAIHPKQLEAINAVYTPTEKEVIMAKAVIEAYHRAESGPVIFDGKLVERPVIIKMQQILAIAQRVSS